MAATTVVHEGAAAVAPEARSGLAPWTRAELPVAPNPRGLGWLAVVGPGVIVLGASIGSGEFLLGPAAFVRHGLSLLWVTGIAIFLQTIFNTECMRYTVATGEPVYTAFMRTRPSATAWGWFYGFLHVLQLGWPAWAANAAGAIFFLATRRLATPNDAAIVYYIGIGTFLLCVGILLVGRRIEQTLELLNWILVACILGAFAVLAVLFVDAGTWLSAAAGYAGFDTEIVRRFEREPSHTFADRPYSSPNPSEAFCPDLFETALFEERRIPRPLSALVTKVGPFANRRA